jgi:IS5 family transposase
MEQQTFSDMEYSNRKKKTKWEEFMKIMDEIIPWEKWVGIVEPVYPNGKLTVRR